jgi:flagellar biosynthesis/type III secretory pathway M-ring protein FliF/YscJ
MELSGEEKKLQALFSELKAADEQTAPRFGATWNRAQSAPRRVRWFNPAFVAAMMLLVFGVVAFAVWSRYSRPAPAPQPAVVKTTQSPATTTTDEAPSAPVEAPLLTPKNPVIASRRNKATSRHNAMLAANRKLEKDAKSIANWTSPTSALLESPSDEIFNSLPELNQSATQLKSFLPSRSN